MNEEVVMKKRPFALLALVFVVLLSCFLAGEAVAVDKNAVKAAMAGYIEKNTTDGVYYIDGTPASFDYIHSGVSKKGGLYVSCADFKAGEDTFDIDYYVKEEGGKFVVVKEVFHKKSGKKIDRVLWSEK